MLRKAARMSGQRYRSILARVVCIVICILHLLVGGELKGYTELLQESRSEATQRMIAQAQELGANAVVNVRYTTSSVAQGASEILAYGTAVRVE